jgi:uncharacterized protein DUF6602
MSYAEEKIEFPGVLRETIGLWGEQLELELKKTRQTIDHRGEKGDLNEKAFREFLRAHLSPRFRVGKGEVIDAQGRRSKQIDVAIADDEQPFRVDDTSRQLIIEGITAAAEVKTTLTRSQLDDCIDKGRHFKSLEAILGKFWSLAGVRLDDGVVNSDFARFYKRRPFFVFAYEEDIAADKMIEVLQEGEDGVSLPPIDALFVLNRGWALNLWDGNTSLAFTEPGTGRRTKGWIFSNDSRSVLPQLILWLHIAMPRFGIRMSPLLAYIMPGTFIPDIVMDVPGQVMGGARVTLVPGDTELATFVENASVDLPVSPNEV